MKQAGLAFNVTREGTHLDAEIWICQRLREHLGLTFSMKILDGVLTADQRCERIRIAILENALSSVIIGRRHGKNETYQTTFERLYGVKL